LTISLLLLLSLLIPLILQLLKLIPLSTVTAAADTPSTATAAIVPIRKAKMNVAARKKGKKGRKEIETRLSHNLTLLAVDEFRVKHVKSGILAAARSIINNLPTYLFCNHPC